MSEFVAFWPRPDAQTDQHDLADATKTILADGFCESAGTPQRSDDAWLVVSSPDSPGIRFQCNDAGFIAIKGAMLRCDSIASNPTGKARHAKSHNDLDLIFSQFCSGQLAPETFEGSFALVAWDAKQKRGIAFNDQTSVLHEYHASEPNGHYIGTSSLVLAKVLKRPLDPVGTREFLLRGCVTGRTTMYENVGRLELGEHLVFSNGHLKSDTHWSPYQPTTAHQSVDEAASHIASRTTDLMRRYADAMGPVIVDLTGGYDSRLLASAAHFAGALSSVTVNGSKETVEDARLSLQVAKAAGWNMKHFVPAEEYDQPITAKMRRELTYRTGGDMPFNSIYHHQFTRPKLAEEFCLHGIGVGGEFTRYHCWGQEFTGIGRRQTANLKNLLNYRYFTGKPFPAALLTSDWLRPCWDDLHTKLKSVCDLQPDALTTQQLDAVHLWKMMGHSSLYVSSLHHWLPTCAPLMNRSFVDACVAVPWRMRLSSGLQRKIIYQLAPAAARAMSAYGAPAAPLMLTNAHQHAWQLVRRMKHLVEKVARVYTKRNFGPQRQPPPTLRYDTPELREFLTPGQMLSSAMYGDQGLRELIGQPNAWAEHRNVVARIATIEQLCHELDWTPSKGFLD